MTHEKRIRVLVVDDVASVRKAIGRIIKSAPGLELAGVAADGWEALELLEQLQPDVITLDVDMPGLDGLQTLDGILRLRPTPTLMVSSMTQRAADVTFQVLDRGALDYVAKPNTMEGGLDDFAAELTRKLRLIAGADVQRILQIRQRQAERAQRTTRKASVGASNEPHPYRDCCIALGISTGGPPALSTVLQSATPPLPPIVIVQHMPTHFTATLAARLDSISDLHVKEAETGDALLPDHVYVAAGGRHLRLRRRGQQVLVGYSNGEPVSSHKPSVDVMMEDAARAYGSACLGVIMTGMGRDGVAGCEAIRAAGGFVLGQDEATSVVYGMNKAAFIEGHVDMQFALESLPKLMSKHAPTTLRPIRASQGSPAI